MKKDNLKNQYRINEKIKELEIRLTGNNVEPGVYSLKQALEIAKEQGLDVVEISPNAEPPVCKILDFQKFIYQQKKRQKELKAKSVKIVVKEIRFGPQTDSHDYNFKLKHARKFLEDGAKVKAYVFFRGRSILFKEQGEVMLLRFVSDLEDCGKLDQMPTLEGKRMIIMLSPKKSGGVQKRPAKPENSHTEQKQEENQTPQADPATAPETPQIL
jgi:translation initiation factor IF-3